MIKQSVKIKPFHSEGERRRKAAEIELSEEEKTALERAILAGIRPVIMNIVEKAFRRYCKQGHKAPDDVTQLEWERFEKFLRRVL